MCPHDDVKKKYANIFEKNWQTTPLIEVALKSYTSFGCYGKADILLVVNNEQELKDFLILAKKFKYNWFIIGRGSNCIFIDDCLLGILVVLRGDFKNVAVDKIKKKIYCGAACFNAVVARNLRGASLTGGEFLNAIPGTVGGGITMNAGAFGSEFRDITSKVFVMDKEGNRHSFDNAQCEFSYRSSIFLTKKMLILAAELEFKAGKSNDITKLEKYFLTTKIKHQPVKAATWGSVFMNPVQHSAGVLIEQCGLKGKKIGDAKISDKHANFIENLGNAKYADIKALIDLARNEVWKKFSINLSLEGRCIDKHGNEV